MKRTKFLCYFFVGVLSVAHGQAVKDPVMPATVRISSRAQMIASLERSRPSIGEPLILHFRLKNVSSLVIATRSFGTSDYWVIVTDTSGTELPLTREGVSWRKPFLGGSVVSTFLRPGEEDDRRPLDLTKLYRLDRPGNYFVRIAWRMGVPPDIPSPKTPEEMAKVPIEEAVSDLIPFTIVP